MNKILVSKLKSALVLGIISLMFTSAIYATTLETLDEDYFFTLVAKTFSFESHSDHLNLLKQHLARIGISVDIIICDWLGFGSPVVSFRNADIFYGAYPGGGQNPDFNDLYTENGSLNTFGYNTDMDYNETLGTGENEWYVKQGVLVSPPNSDERVQHYWDWENYLMDEILPCLPNLIPYTYTAYWDTLEGYNISKGILQSWGSMKWHSSHYGQQSIDEFVVSDNAWSDLNPLYQEDASSAFISKCIMDPLIYIDNDKKDWPHLAESYIFLNETHLRITTRDGIKWQDYEGFTDEEFNAEDVYFSLYSWKWLSNEQPTWSWIEKIELIDEKTIDILIDPCADTIDNEPFPNVLTYLDCLILPEHYLNQTQLGDGRTPDNSHSSWDTFASKCFGTGLFSFDSQIAGIETILSINDNSWWINATITNDSSLEWIRRFGDFIDTINYLRIKIEPNYQTSLNGFSAGSLDYYNFDDLDLFMDQTEGTDGITMQKEIQPYYDFFGFNLRPTRSIIGNPEPCENDTTMTKGLAIRKAISHAINREEINNIIHRGEYSISKYPIYETMGIWCNPNIITYDYDLEMAKYYMALAGYNVPEHSNNPHIPPENFLWVYILAGVSYAIGTGVLISGWIYIRRKKRRK